MSPSAVDLLVVPLVGADRGVRRLGDDDLRAVRAVRHHRVVGHRLVGGGVLLVDGEGDGLGDRLRLVIASVMSATASSTAEIQSLLALGPVRGNIAPIVTSIGGVVGVLLSLPQPPKAAGISNDNAAPSMVTFWETLVGGSWLMPCQIGSARDLLERRRAPFGRTAPKTRAREQGCAVRFRSAARRRFRAPALRFEARPPRI